MSHDDFFAELGIQRDEDAGDAKDKPKSRRQRRMEKVERRQRKRRRHWLTSLVIVITLAAVGVLGYKAIGIMRDASAQATHAEDYKGEGEGEVTVTIPEGASGADIGDILQSKGVVASGKAFTNAAKNNPKGNTIQPGTYKLKKKMSANSALQALLDPESKGDHTLTIPAGVSKQIVKDRLKKVGSFTDEQIEAAYADSAAIGLPAEAGGNVEGWLAPGTYDVTENATPKDLVKKKMSANSALQALLDPESKGDHTLTIPAGVSKQIVKDRLKKVGSFTDEQIEAAYADSAAIGLPAEAGGNVEGWLAPGTYDVTENATPKDLVKKMVSQTVTQLKELKVPKEDYQKVLTKASIVEREVNSERYYGQAARVIENRLSQTDGETHGLLQMDSTVQYGLGRYGGIPTEAETQDANNPYNTYVHKGLPPGPIGSPGEAAIKAVLNPPAGSWLYFVTVNLETGETLFASTNEEQKANTKKLNDYCKKNQEICNGEKKSG